EFAVLLGEAACAVDRVDDPQPGSDVRHCRQRRRGFLRAQGIFGKSLVKVLENDLLSLPVRIGGDVSRGVGNRLKACVLLHKMPAGQVSRRERRFQFALVHFGSGLADYASAWLATAGGPLSTPANSLNSRYCKCRYRSLPASSSRCSPAASILPW